MPKVAVLKTTPETVLEDYKKLMHLAEYKKFISKKNDTILKLNLSWSLYYPACSTQPWQLEGVLKTLVDDGYKNIFPVENETVVTDVHTGVKLNKWLPVLKRYGQMFVPLTDVEWVRYQPKAEMLALHEIFPQGNLIPKMFIGKNVVHFPTMKVHGHTTITGAMKNAFGGLITKKRHHCHKKIHEVLVDLLAIQKEIHPCIFAVMDGTVAGDGAGPRTMIPRVANYLIAGADQVAVDAVAAKIMGFDPMKIKFINLAHDQGLGIGDTDQIDIVGEDVSRVNLGFTTQKSPVIFWDQVFRKGPMSFIEPYLFHTKLFHLAIFGSEFYHDHLWYPTVGKGHIRRFEKTGWGQLWKRY